MSKEIFPNGFTSWHETHFEVVSTIWELAMRDDDDNNVVAFTYTMGGKGALYELAEDWTNQFEERNKNRVWDGEFFDGIEQFIKEKISK